MNLCLLQDGDFINEGIEVRRILSKQLRRTNLLFTIAGKHIEITDSFKVYAEEKTSKLPRFYSSINRVEVVVDQEQGGSSLSVEVIARAERSKVFVVTERGEDAYRCIDLAIRKLERQLRRTKTKERDNKHRGNSELR